MHVRCRLYIHIAAQKELVQYKKIIRLLEFELKVPLDLTYLQMLTTFFFFEHLFNLILTPYIKHYQKKEKSLYL